MRVQNRACGVTPLMHHVAAAVERLAVVVGAGEEGDAVAGADRQFAAARDGGAGIGVGILRAGLAARRSRRRSEPRRTRCRGSASAMSCRGRPRPRSAKASRRSENQAHDRSGRMSVGERECRAWHGSRSSSYRAPVAGRLELRPMRERARPAAARRSAGRPAAGCAGVSRDRERRAWRRPSVARRAAARRRRAASARPAAATASPAAGDRGDLGLRRRAGGGFGAMPAMFFSSMPWWRIGS